MKLIIFASALMLILTAASLAAGLEVTEIDFSVDYDDAYTYRIENRDRIDSVSGLSNNSKINADVLPGSNITFTLRIANTFETLDLKNVFSTIRIKDIDDGSDMEQDTQDIDLDAGDDFRYDVGFSVPLEVDAGTYDVLIDTEAEDKNGTAYRTGIILKLEVKKQNHDIRIIRYDLNPSVVECDRKIRLSADIMNVGSNPESQLALELNSTSLGIKSIDRDISLESSDEAGEEEKIHTKTLNLELPRAMNAGKYFISSNLYWKNLILFDRKDLELTVRNCGTGSNYTSGIIPNRADIDDITSGLSNQTREPQAQQYPLSRQKSLPNSPALWFMVIAAAIVIITAGFIAYYSKR